MKIYRPSQNWADAATKSVFLAGPTHREKGKYSWRDKAAEYFQHFGFEGNLFLPEPFIDGTFEQQIAWEAYHLDRAKCIMFWIPRDMKNGLPALTTNIEWGRWENSGKVVLGAPEHADNMRYIKFYARRNRVPTADKLHRTVKLAMEMVEK